MLGLGFWTLPRPGLGPGLGFEPGFVLELELASVVRYCSGVVAKPEVGDRFGCWLESGSEVCLGFGFGSMR